MSFEIDPDIFCGYGWLDDIGAIRKVLYNGLKLKKHVDEYEFSEVELFKKACKKYKVRGLVFLEDDDGNCVIGQQIKK